MKKVKKKENGNQENKSFRQIWFAAWWPVLLVVALFLAVGTLLVDQSLTAMEEEAFSSVVNDQLDYLNEIQSNYDQEVQDDSAAAYEHAMAALEWLVNVTVASHDMAAAYLCDDQGTVLLEQRPALYIRTDRGLQAYYRCADQEVEQQILERYEAWMDQLAEGDRPILRIDEIYIQGSKFYPVRVNIYTMEGEYYHLQEEVIIDVSLPAEDSTYLTGLDLLRDGDSVEDMLQRAAAAKEAGTYYTTNVYVAEPQASLEDMETALLANIIEEDRQAAELRYASVASTYEVQRKNNKTYRQVVIPIVFEDTQYYFVLLKQKQVQSTVYVYVALGWVVGILFSAFIALVIAKGFSRTMKKEQELVSRQRDYTNALAHDLKTPLMAISGYTENLQSNMNPEKQEHYYEAIYSNIDYMSGLIKDMLSLARLQRPEETLCKERIELRKLAEGTAACFELERKEKKLQLEIQGSGYMEADPQLMERALKNLVENAVKYSPAGEAIRIRLADNRIQITNTGVTLPKEKWNTVFQPYVKGDEARERESGIGLGLAIVKDIAELHGFQCRLECTEQATTVTVEG